ncbi:ABC transporter permease [Canibacter zhuwentaonis]|uniref:ABC transporter permease n=1 Tax=Canibacter zhuwentaonis TaxID=2837491 RepID=UPI0032B4F342
MNTRTIEKYRKDPDYATPGKSYGLLHVLQHRYLLRLIMKKGVATRYYGSALGWAWSYVKPGTQFLMYYIVIGVIMGINRDIDFFPIYLFSGIVAVNFFTETLHNTTSAIVDNRELVRKIFLPRELFPVSACGVALVHFLPQALLLLIVAIFSGWTVSWLQIIYFIVGVFLILCFALGLGLFFGAINAVYRDAKNFVDMILMFATWISPVLYSFAMVRDRAPEWLYQIYMVNPMTASVELFHNTFWLPLAPHSERPTGLLTYALIASAIALCALLIGQLVFKKLEGTFAQRL